MAPSFANAHTIITYKQERFPAAPAVAGAWA
jgi:hypothetical protein